PGEARRKVDQSSLRSLVLAYARLGLCGRRASDLDDAAPALGAHARCEVLNHAHGGAHVLLVSAGPIFERDLQPVGVARRGLATGVVDQNIQALELTLHGLRYARGAVGSGKVA